MLAKDSGSQPRGEQADRVGCKVQSPAREVRLTLSPTVSQVWQPSVYAGFRGLHAIVKSRQVIHFIEIL